ncbi:MAG: Calx-beta domain-containing protein, partial [Reyranella sp.]
ENDDGSTVSIAAASASQAEGDAGTTAFTFTVTLDRAGVTAQTVSYAVSGSGEHAADAADFLGAVFPAGTLTFEAGETSKTVMVNVSGDTLLEADESFVLDLSAPSSGLVIGTASAAATILNDDAAGPPALTVVNDDVYVGFSGEALHIRAADGVLFNDVGVNLAASLLSEPAHGMVTVGGGGGFDYTPLAGFSGKDSFTYLGMGAAGGEYRTVDIHIAGLTPDLSLDLQSLTGEQLVAMAYTGVLGRGADAAGLAFWLAEFNAGLPQFGAAAMFSSIADSLALGTEAMTLYPFLGRAQDASDTEIGAFLDGVYNNLFNRPADADELIHWTGQIRQAIAAGQFVGSVLDDIVGGARNSEESQDAITVMNKIAVGLTYVHYQERYHAPWTVADDAAGATALVDAVTADPQTPLVGVVQAYDLVIASLVRTDGFGDIPISAF